MTQEQPGLFERARSFKKQVECIDWLKAKGFKADATRFSRDFKSGLIERNADGRFEEPALLTYANIHLELDEQLAVRAAQQAKIDKENADARVKDVQARRLELKLLKEEGKMMPRAEYERDLAARALFFMRQLKNWPRLFGPGLLHLLGAPEDRLPDLVRFWEESSADLTDAWAKEREFTVAVGGDINDEAGSASETGNEGGGDE